jgi:hypothetical protein
VRLLRLVLLIVEHEILVCMVTKSVERVCQKRATLLLTCCTCYLASSIAVVAFATSAAFAAVVVASSSYAAAGRQNPFEILMALEGAHSGKRIDDASRSGFGLPFDSHLSC